VQRILLSCGEASGERHAIKLLEELKSSPVEVHAFGGLRLAEMPGVQLHINLVDRAVMGITGALAELPFFMRAVGRWMEMLDEIQPDAVVLVDNPGLHMLLAEQARKRDIPVLYYICPQYWAWASWRMDRFARTVDAAMAILPFEPPLFADAGIPTGFAGHPMLHEEHPPRPLAEREDLLLLLPGSRSKELERHTEGMLRIAIQVRRRHPQLRVVIPQSSPKHAARLRTRLEEHEGADFVEIIEEEPREWLPRARVALVKSGTSTMETAIAGTPMVICYHLTSLSEQIMLRWIVNTPWIGAPISCSPRRSSRSTHFGTRRHGATSNTRSCSSSRTRISERRRAQRCSGSATDSADRGRLASCVAGCWTELATRRQRAQARSSAQSGS
jgi:lipid-A-disaccharide synthase